MKLGVESGFTTTEALFVICGAVAGGDLALVRDAEGETLVEGAGILRDGRSVC